jgi:hypothetical protein
MDNEYLAYYQTQLKHQSEHGDPRLLTMDVMGRRQPWDRCLDCLKEGRIAPADREQHAVKKHFAWAVPNDDALAAVAKHSPNGVVEIGAGGGYWAGMLRACGVDVVAYDPAPPKDGPTKWHSKPGGWSDVDRGDHRTAARHPGRTLLLVWPSCEEAWAGEAVRRYHKSGGDTVIYVGEGPGGCTGDDTLHRLLGADDGYCTHHLFTSEDCDCVTRVEPLFSELDDVTIPQWFGIHDHLTVYRRMPDWT